MINVIFRSYLRQTPVVGISYLAGCGGRGKAAVIDPMLEDIPKYMEDAKLAGMEIKYVIDTHIHADHISGARKLIELTNAAYVLHESVQAGFPFYAVTEGDIIELGNTFMMVLHTPGHTPEHISLVVSDHSRADQPWFVLTGHTLMVGDVGRTELAVDGAEGARQLFHSVFDKLLSLPEHLEVFPGAFSGSVCGRSLSGKPSSTIGFEKRYNRSLQMKTEEEFVQFMLHDVPKSPMLFNEIRAFNMGHIQDAPSISLEGWADPNA
ncbi:MAG TPA: MBL fold metallo-hydrolase [Bacilli bacterium]